MRLGGALSLEAYSEPSTSQTRICKTETCKETTREGKLFCTDHVELHPYVQYLLKRIADRATEDEKVRMQGATSVNISGITVQEILLQLKQNGTRTVERLTREIQLDKTVIRNYVIAMRNSHLVRLGWTVRNSISVTLIDQNPSDLIGEES